MTDPSSPVEDEEPPREPNRVDLRGVGFDAWLAFCFDHPAVRPGSGDEWYWRETPEIEVDPREQVSHLARLFGAPEVLRERFTEDQVEQGLWFLLSSYEPERFVKPLWNSAVPWTERRACIAALPELYLRLFEHWGAEFGTAPEMIPDFLVFDYDLGRRHPDVDAEDSRVQDAFKDAFVRMLYEGDWMTRHAALHGLGHLRHPEGFAEVVRWLAAHPPEDDDQREYAERVAAGEEVL